MIVMMIAITPSLNASSRAFGMSIPWHRLDAGFNRPAAIGASIALAAIAGQDPHGDARALLPDLPLGGDLRFHCSISIRGGCDADRHGDRRGRPAGCRRAGASRRLSAAV